MWCLCGILSYNLSCVLPSVYPEPDYFIVGLAIVNNFVFFLFFIAFLKCAVTDAGRVPPHYGFYIGDDSKRRRYCKICHVWKPERTHHCSQCKRCVLLMDHHCPWVNNCIGFYNRKFFIQLQVYGIVWFLMTACHSSYELVNS